MLTLYLSSGMYTLMTFLICEIILHFTGVYTKTIKPTETCSYSFSSQRNSLDLQSVQSVL